MYGIEAASPDDEYIVLEEAAQDISNKAYFPGRYLVELLPILRYVPAWLPGAQFKRDAARWRVTMQATRNKPFDAALERQVCACLSKSNTSLTLCSMFIAAW